MNSKLFSEGVSTAPRRPDRPLFTPNRSKRLEEQVHEVCRFFHYARRTEEAYWGWIQRFLRFHRVNLQWRRPETLRALEVVSFLSNMATERGVAAATQNQALNALVFLYKEVLHLPLGELADLARIRRPARLPAVLSRDEVQKLWAVLTEPVKLPLQLQ